jgi:DNA-binding NarL/FixJ family response regulator
MQAVRVLIVDDDFYAREALRSLLARDSRTRVWGEAADVDEALEALADSASSGTPLPEVILLDVRLHDRELGGIDGIPHLRSAAQDAKVLVTSVSRDESTVLAAIEAGADGYVWKNESAEGIAAAIERVAEGRFVLTPGVAERLVGTVAELALEAAEVLPERSTVELTETVRRTVYLYCVCGMSAREIADELQLSVNTVNARIRTAYAVLGAGSRREAFERLVANEETR